MFQRTLFCIEMTLATRHTDFGRRDLWKDNDLWLDDFNDWPMDWPKPRDFFHRFSRNTDNWWKEWPVDWPRMDAVMPRFSTQLDRLDNNWRKDPFWMDIYPRWAEPIFKDGIDVNSNVVNDERRFAVDVDCYQFRPEEIQVKTLDDTLLIEGRHEDVRDRDNFTKMYFIRKYQLPKDVDFNSIQSSIDSKGKLNVEAAKFSNALNSRERLIPIEGAGRNSPRFESSTLRSQRGPNSPIHIQTEQDSRSASSRSGSRAERLNDSPGSRDVYSSHSYSYHRSDSRNRLSPHDVPIRTTENRAYSPAASRVTTSERTVTPEQRSPGKQVFDTIRNNFEQGAYNGSATNGNTINHQQQHQHQEERSSSRAQSSSHRSESRNGYRVDSPASSTTGILRNGNNSHVNLDSPTQQHREYRSIQILRKTY
ncbi:unnamed protein product [Caenorhabditis angaria]|uniref:SHSP domain-containing protein n=1 Tax=Caenorhabditis angaria TaxID=860376 RepID=A0A9P1N8G2_9PELO|nr:unnamed protein product [Caenorhabditis angaria]